MEKLWITLLAGSLFFTTTLLLLVGYPMRQILKEDSLPGLRFSEGSDDRFVSRIFQGALETIVLSVLALFALLIFCLQSGSFLKRFRYQRYY